MTPEPVRSALDAIAESVALVLERGLRIEQVCSKTGISKTRVYQLIKAERFPRPRKVDGTAIWLESEVSRWLRELPGGGC